MTDEHVISLDVVLGDPQMCVGNHVEGIDYPI
jgi:hypothetical protein